MNKKIRTLLGAILGFTSLFALVGCNSKTKYLEGEVCGDAMTEGTTFNQIRKSYCEKYAYSYYQQALEDTNIVSAEFKEDLTAAFAKKYTYTDKPVEVQPGEDAYVTAHYLFTYYTVDHKDVIDQFVTSSYTNATEASQLISLTTLAAYGNETEKYSSSHAYFNKCTNSDLDENAPEVTYNGETTTLKSIKESLNGHSKACLVFEDNFVDQDTGNVIIPKTTWQDAWDVGILYGLFVYPMALLINQFVTWFGSTGWGQVGAILVVTFILKVAIFLLTFNSQKGTQKMQDIQPEILKIQAKYGQNPSQEDRQKMSMELMAVYEKYGVKPLAPFASLLITFPVFIAMYRAVMYLGVLRTGNIAGVTLGYTLSSYIIGENRFNWFAIVIFIVMAGTQILSMKLPQLLNSKRLSREAKEQQKQANTITNVMMIMILVMGFMMPVTMSIYWIASAAVALLQSLLMHKLNNSSKDGKFKVKKVETHATIPQGYKSK